MDQENAFKYLIRFLREKPSTLYSSHGYDLYLPVAIRAYLTRNGQDPSTLVNEIPQNSPVFLAAAWELARRGIIRPGIRSFNEQSTTDGSAGFGYSITPFGKQWLEESNQDDFVPTEPERFGAMIKPFKIHFGDGFHQRAQEAIRCYGAHAYLACCAMCGAAAESILLSLAIKKEGDEEKVLKTYSSAGGRAKIENKLLGQTKKHIKREFRGHTTLLKYWRDESAHGVPSIISDSEAYTSITLLLRLAKFAKDNLKELTTGGS